MGVITVGQPESVRIEPNGKTTVTTKKNSNSAYNLIADQFAKFDTPVICLSGGLDSQFVALMAKTFSTDPICLIFKFVWDDNVINAFDVCLAERLCHRHNMEYETQEVNLNDLYSGNNLENYARKYKCYSPQIIPVMVGIKDSYLCQHEIVLLGGELPLIGVDNNTASIALPRLAGQAYHLEFLSYMTFAKAENINIVRDPFYMSHSILYAAYRQNVKVIKESKKIASVSRNRIQSNPQVYKQLYYGSYGFDFIFPVEKSTGFEILRKHMAAATGNYDEFDKTYRKPLELLREPISNQVNFVGDGLGDVVQSIQKLIDANELDICNTYKFDW